MVVGAYAVGVHGRPRATKDLDVWVEPSVENAPKVMRALGEFGAPLMGLTQKDCRSDASRCDADFGDGVRCPVIGLDALLANKRAAARPQDLADVAALEKARAKSGR